MTPQKSHILIVEDDPDLAEGLRYNLERNGAFTAQIAVTGEEALMAIYGDAHKSKTWPGYRYALIILDVNLPGLSGFELCCQFRADERTRLTPILMLTARAEEQDKVRGLESGADDYVTKPFSTRELLARVQALLRRAEVRAGNSSVYNDGVLCIDYAGFHALCREEPLKLTRKEFGTLALLTRSAGRVVARERLLDEVWGINHYGDARTLDVHISSLRKKLGVCGERIETVIGIGYRYHGQTNNNGGPQD